MMTMQHLLLVRHGETVGNLEQIAHGQTESPLNDRGIEQAQLTAEMLRSRAREFHRVYASPLSRACDTARAIADALDLPLHVHSELIEGSLGDLEGKTYEELDSFGFARHSIRDDDFDGHNGESPNMLGQRIMDAIDEIRSRHQHENIILVSHGGAIAHYLARLLGTKPAFGHQYLMHNAAVSEVCFHGDKDPQLTTLNHHDHLPEHLKSDPARRDNNVSE